MSVIASTMLLMSILAPDPACTTDASPKQLEARQSPLDSVRVEAFGGVVKVCYGRPSVRDRTIFGGLVPYGSIWRAGANEPTIVHTTQPIMLAGIRLEPGAYSLYLVPMEGAEWELVVNRSTSQWGIESHYDNIKDQEVARAMVPVERVSDSMEQLTVALTPATISLAWEFARVRIPVTAAR